MDNRGFLMKRFTLLELLVVIGVIAILLSLLMPSLGAARKKAKLAVCASNNSQILRALSTYVTINDQMTPSKWYKGNLTNGQKPGHGWLGIKTNNHPWNYRSLNIYLGVPDSRSDIEKLDVAKCPLDNYSNGGRGGDSYFDYDGHSYMGNARSGGNVALNNGNYGIFISKVSTAPSRMVALNEFGGWHTAFGYNSNWGYSWHGKYMYTLGFLDGHAKNVRISRGLLISESYSFDKNQ